MRVPIVNEQDEIIGHKERDDLTSEDIGRASGVWFVNSKGEVLLAQRAAVKKFNPLIWGVSAAGMVDEGESYAENIIREVREELGITIREDELIPGAHRLIRRSAHVYFYQSYYLKQDIAIEDVVLQKEEVENVRWISIPDLKKWVAEKPEDFFPTFPASIADLEGFVASKV